MKDYAYYWAFNIEKSITTSHPNHRAHYSTLLSSGSLGSRTTFKTPGRCPQAVQKPSVEVLYLLAELVPSFEKTINE
jgi:hypothetical protein